MCRLFGLTAGPHRVHTRFWLLEAPDSIVAQSHRNADGTGLAFYEPDGEPVLDKEPLAAFEDSRFARRRATSARDLRRACPARVDGRRCARRNTHPFTMDGRVMAHNGAISGLPLLEQELGGYRDKVLGDTDSERMFALITQVHECEWRRCRRRHPRGGDVDRREHPGLRDQPDPDDARRAVGVPLPRDAPAVRPAARGGWHPRRPAAARSQRHHARALRSTSRGTRAWSWPASRSTSIPTGGCSRSASSCTSRPISRSRRRS